MAKLTVTTLPTDDPRAIRVEGSDKVVNTGAVYYQITNISDKPVEIDVPELVAAIKTYEVVKAVEDAAAELGLHTLKV